MTGAYPPISDYAIIGCTRSAALISREGSIDWLCWPRFDSPSLFARILDHERGGWFFIRPAVPFTAKRRYIDGTNVLETTFTTDRGRLRLVDLMPVMTEEEKRHRLTPFRQLLRRIEAIDGDIPVEVEYAPRPDYARTVPKLQVRGDSVVCSWTARVLHLRSNAEFHIGERGLAKAAFILAAEDSRSFALGYDDHTPAVMPPLDSIDETVRFWQDWSLQFSYDGAYGPMVLRSVLLLKLLSYAPSGGIVAAPTTSLPEELGGIRNWDYRYCWLRDASFTVSALYDCGFEREGAAFLDWLVYSTRLTHPSLMVLYDVFGEAKISERDIASLTGYRGSKPVRAGNGAHDQFQLDVYGEVLGAAEEAADRGEKLSGDAQRLMRRLADQVVRRWREPDSGIWEKRAGRRQHIHAKIMAWSALDCAERMVEHGQLRADASTWQRVKEEIRAYVMAEGFDDKQNSFIGVPGSPDVDASLLYVARVGFLEPDDSRMLGTIEAIRKKLGHGDLLYRYDTRTTEDGLPAGEGAFVACSFWLVEALALAGRDREARKVFEQLLERANDVGLFSEEMNPESGEMLGNFPQALSHIALINAALCLENAAPRINAGRKTRQ